MHKNEWEKKGIKYWGEQESHNCWLVKCGENYSRHDNSNSERKKKYENLNQQKSALHGLN